ncbi:MAG: hypothetical protein LBQ50_08845 [Planctomycetaceae bacterium]|jgi:hypothetical protein|nr:hypothetical protein [Planctomycetaceae bacterium]
MSGSNDYMPSKDADFDGWFENLSRYVAERVNPASPIWSFIPLDTAAELSDHYTTWHSKYQVTRGAHTNVDTEAKNDAKKVAKKFIRPFVAQYLKFPPVTDEDRTAMRLHNRDPKPTPIAVPSTRVVITDMRAIGGFQIRIWFRDEQTPNSNAIPYGCNGCLINFAWGKERITDVTALKESKLLTRSPETITLPPESQSEYFSCVMRWQNKKGQLGPWGDVQSIVIG